MPLSDQFAISAKYKNAKIRCSFRFTELRPAQVVHVRWGMGIKGCMAADLRPDGVPPGLPPKH